MVAPTILRLGLLAAAGLHGVHAWAQAADPATVLQEQLRRLDKAAPPGAARPAPPSRAVTPPEPAPAVPTTVPIREIQFSRSELLSAEELTEVARRFVGRPLSAADLNRLLQEVAALYAAKSVLSAAPLLPRQDLGQGVLRVLLVEGRLGEIHLREGAVASEAWVRGWFPLQPGQVVRSQALDSAVRLFNATSDFVAQSRIVAGTGFASSDIELALVRADPMTLWASVEVDDLTRDDGRQASAGLRWAPFSARGGRLDVAAVRTDTSHAARVSASMPVVRPGLRLGLQGASGQSETVLTGQTGEPLRIEGRSASGSLELRQTVAAGPQTLWSWGLATSQVRSRSRLGGEELNRTEIARHTLSVGVSHDTERNSALLNVSAHAGRAAGGSYSFAEVQVQFTRTLDASAAWTTKLAWLARLADHGPVPAGDAFALGGPTTVRGFDASAAAGRGGHALQFDLRRALPVEHVGRGAITVFADAGLVRTPMGNRQLASVGVGGQFQLSTDTALELAWTRQVTGAIGARERLSTRLSTTW